MLNGSFFLIMFIHRNNGVTIIRIQQTVSTNSSIICLSNNMMNT